MFDDLYKLSSMLIDGQECEGEDHRELQQVNNVSRDGQDAMEVSPLKKFIIYEVCVCVSIYGIYQLLYLIYGR